MERCAFVPSFIDKEFYSVSLYQREPVKDLVFMLKFQSPWLFTLKPMGHLHSSGAARAQAFIPSFLILLGVSCLFMNYDTIWKKNWHILVSISSPRDMEVQLILSTVLMEMKITTWICQIFLSLRHWRNCLWVQNNSGTRWPIFSHVSWIQACHIILACHLICYILEEDFLGPCDCRVYVLSSCSLASARWKPLILPMQIPN